MDAAYSPLREAEDDELDDASLALTPAPSNSTNDAVHNAGKDQGPSGSGVSFAWEVSCSDMTLGCEYCRVFR